MEFNKEDIGKRVVLSLDPKTNDIAKALRASEVSIQGDILDVTDTYLEIKTVPWCVGPIPIVSQRYRIKQIPYGHIIGCEFLQ